MPLGFLHLHVYTVVVGFPSLIGFSIELFNHPDGVLMPFKSSMNLLRFACRCSRLFVVDHSGVLRAMARASIDGQIATLVSASCHSKFDSGVAVWA